MAKTSRGSRNSSRNARKHGLLARVFTWGSAAEEREFDQLLTEIRQALQPANRLEDLAVEEIAVSYARLQRAQRLEEDKLAEAQRAPIGPIIDAFMQKSAGLKLPVDMDALSPAPKSHGGGNSLPLFCQQLHLRLTRGRGEENKTYSSAQERLEMQKHSSGTQEGSGHEEQDRVEMDLQLSDALGLVMRYRTSITRELDRALLRFERVRSLRLRRRKE